MSAAHLFQRVALAVLLALLFSRCSHPPDSLEEIRERGTLRVLTRNGATTYYESQGRPTGFEYHLVKGFADQLGVKLEIIPVVGMEDIFQGLKEGRGDIAAAGLTITESRQKYLMFGPSYMDIKQFFIYNREYTPSVDRVDDMIGKRIRVIGSSSHSEILQDLQQTHPDLSWTESRDQEPVDLLEMLANNQIDLTIVDSNEFYANRAFYPEFRITLAAGKPGRIAWAVAASQKHYSLLAEMQVYFTSIKENGKLANLKDRFFTLNEKLSFISSHTFLDLKEKRLPKYKGLIEQVAIEYDVDWRLLAAISYQESHWNPSAKSPTGVRGMMMLTRPTAKELGVKNRLDPLQSLRGGVRYYKQLYNRLPVNIQPPDRSWFALAAYNIGLGHLEDARVLTQKNGGDPNQWKDVKVNLPLLRQRKWYKQTRHGYARGDEPVRYVENIRNYYSLLTWDELNRYRVPPPRRVVDYLPAELTRGFDAL